MKVRNIFHPAVACLDPAATLAAAARLMRAGEFGSVAIYDGDRLAGILTEADVVRGIAERRDAETTPVAQMMSAEPVTIGPDDDTAEAALRMVKGGFRHLPVVEEGRLVGMLSASDLLEVEAWPVVRRGHGDIDSIEHPVRPVRHRLVDKPS